MSTLFQISPSFKKCGLSYNARKDYRKYEMVPAILSQQKRIQREVIAMKKLVPLFLAAGLACSMLGGAVHAEEASGDVTIWYYWETEGHQKALGHIIEEFNNSQDSITVEAKYVPFADFKKQLSIGASADELPDLVILDRYGFRLRSLRAAE